MKYNKRRGFFCKKVKRWEVSLLNRGKARGFWAYCPVFSLLPHRDTGEGEALVGGGRCGRSGPRRRLGVEGKGGGGPAGSIPNRSSARGGLRWPGHCGRRRRRWRPWAGVPEGRRRPRGGGSIGGPRWCPNPPQFGPRVEEKGAPRWPAVVMASGGAAG